jgi:hypothetical protein
MHLGILAAAPIVAIALLAPAAAGAGNAPVVNETTHFSDVVFADVGDNCATGNQSARTVTFSGVQHLLVQPNGSVKFSGNFDGTTSFDDLPADQIPDATATFRLVIGEKLLPRGGQHYREVWNGTTAVTGGPQLRFHVTYQLVLDPAGNPRIEVLRFSCE